MIAANLARGHPPYHPGAAGGHTEAVFSNTTSTSPSNAYPSSGVVPWLSMTIAPGVACTYPVVVR